MFDLLYFGRKLFLEKLGLLNKPSLCTFVATYRCNSRCQMCDIWKKQNCKDEMSLSEIKNIFNHKLNCLDVMKITGGEPFLRQDLNLIVQHLFEVVKPRYIQITTNGILTDKIVSLVENFGCRQLHLIVSINGIGQVHDKLTGIEGSYEAVMATIDKSVFLRKKYKFYLGINQVILPHNISQIQSLKELLFQKGIVNIHYSLGHHLFDGNGQTIAPSAYRKFTHSQLLSIFRQIRQDRRQDNIIRDLINRFYMEGLENRLLHHKYEPTFKCTALRNYFRLLPDGNIVTCIVHNNPITNLRQKGFFDIWFTEELNRSREKVKACSGCWFGCEVVPNAVYTGNIIKALFY